MATLTELARRKQGLTGVPVNAIAALWPDLSGDSPWLVGKLPFAVILEQPQPARSAGAVFQLPDGGALAFTAARTAPALGPARASSRCARSGASA
jgi:hypothetical protein